MNLEVNFPVFLTMLGMVGGLCWTAITFGRWAGEMRTMITTLAQSHESMGEDVVSLRKSRHEHSEKIIELRVEMGAAQADIVELRARE